ncbi:ATP-binding protein [Streptomyces sp. NBC_00996]|uniref:ATP-binding response regulator n=1 Tax=Streptomyces sp. NBC_00996 TaxID=2903710 RepID=UPI00386446F4|nr:ATP-binding protein [Streptomyces sp. NBC_00996]
MLIVDDEPGLVEVLSVAVAEAGWRPYPAADGESALRVARGCAPHAVVLDGMLPGLDGVQVLRRLRYEDPKLPVLMLTARDALEHRIEGLSAGADDYVTKPFSLEEVILRLRGLLRRGAALNRMIDHVETSLAERQHTEERMRRFLADAGHELRTPLSSITAYAELMHRGTEKIEPTLAWGRVSAESVRMTGLAEDLLLLARLDEGRPLRSAEVDLTSLVAEAVWDARATGETHDWQLTLRLDAPALVTGDEARLHQVVSNLLTNARVHTPAGTTVTASVEATHEHRVIRVRDDGPGIPPELLPAVFERFTRADASRSRGPGKEAGTGLGLAIATAITSAHGGRLSVVSEPGRTEFSVELPPRTEFGTGMPPPTPPTRTPRCPARGRPTAPRNSKRSHRRAGHVRSTRFSAADSAVLGDPIQFRISLLRQSRPRAAVRNGRAHDERSQRR